MYSEEQYLMISGLQHYCFCPRQWALIHIEQQWSDNAHTTEGELFHKTAHNRDKLEKRGDLLITRGLNIKSADLGVSGSCDVVEFHKDNYGISLRGYEGKWTPVPIEYKKGKPKEDLSDILQLCCEAMCLEEMLLCRIDKGALYYGETNRRLNVEITSDLRETVKKYISEMHAYMDRGYTPKIKWKKSCNACSLNEICMPRLSKTDSVRKYVEKCIGEEK